MALKPGQLRCIQTLDRPIAVAAGAGSGKTFTLTKRIVGALESGFADDIGRICAITFTNKAAAELKSRVKAELRACGMPAQALKVDESWICTIHGMCARILRAHAVELGIDPAFSVADGALAVELLDAAVDAVLAEAESAGTAGAGPGGAGVPAGGALPGADALGALFAEYPARSGGMGGTSVEDMLRDLVGAAAASPRGADALSLPPHGVDAASATGRLVDALEGLHEAAEREKPSANRDDWLARTEGPLQAAREALGRGGVSDPMDALRLVAGLDVRRNFGSKAFKERAAEADGVLAACVMELRLAAAAPHLRTLSALAARALGHFAEGKRAAGVLDNNDLLVLAARALEGHPGIAALYADRFQLVMVDEFQDTDQMQVDMIKRIAGPGACRLCTVGDAQQSIYRFRGADVSVYRRHLASVRALDGGDVILLPDNFRSHADILSFVDRVFERPSMFGGEFMSLAPGRDETQVRRPYPGDEPRVRVQHASTAYRGGVSSGEVVARQARRMADALAGLHEKGVAAGDMAVLLGRMRNAGVYAAALRERGLACVVSGGSVFAESPEAQMMLQLVRVAANPRDTAALYQVLAGPLFHLPDDDLLALGTASDARDGLPRGRSLDAGLRVAGRLLAQDGLAGGAGGNAAMGDEAAEGALARSPRLRCAVRVLGDLRRGAARGGVARALADAMVASGLTSRLEAAGPEGLASAANCYKAIRLVRDLESGGAGGPVSAMRAFEAALACTKEAPGALSATGGNFVRIMTVHASKGLEFPVVAVAEFPPARNDSPKLLVQPDGNVIRLSLDLGRSLDEIGGSVGKARLAMAAAPLLEGRDDEESLLQAARDAGGALELRAALAGYARLGEEEESKRLLYVALTRAKEALIISTRGKRTKGNPNGSPDNCLAALADALLPDGRGFEAGCTALSFGGSAPALVEHLVMEDLDEAGEVPAPPARGDGAPGPDAEADAGASAGRFPVPVPVAGSRLVHVPFAPAREGVFSYSSVAGASHGGDVPDWLASRFSVACDAAARDAEAGPAPRAGVPAAFPAPSGGRGLPGRRAHADCPAPLGAEDDGAWAYPGPGCADSDKATSLGTAFHRLAQLAVDAWRGEGPLVAPPPSRIRPLARSCGLDERQRTRLLEALGRWFGSDEARRMAACGGLRAEVPFIVPVRSDGAPPALLEGEIDLLGFSDGGDVAQVVDYKTGGHADEDEDALRRKHALQASCYAYALLLQGVQAVEASFVRVERPRADDPAQPQCVRYRFAAADRDALERAIARAYRGRPSDVPERDAPSA